jgi:hypothetical protein
MTIQATVQSVFEKVSIDWLAEEPLDTLVRTGKYSAEMVDIKGNHYEIQIDNADVLTVGDHVFLQIN